MNMDEKKIDPETQPVAAVVEAAVGVVADAAVHQSHAAAVEHDAMAIEHAAAADRANIVIQDRMDRRKFWLKMINRIGVWVILGFAAFGAAVFIQSTLSTFDEVATHRNEFVSKCSTAGNRVFEGENEQWVCVKGDVISVTNTSDAGAPSVPAAKAACLSEGHVALTPFSAEEWVYCVDGTVVDVLR